MKLYYVVNARMPSTKAYGIQIAKMCEAFIEHGIELELLIPRTHQSDIPMREFYDLRVDVPTRIFPTPDWYTRGKFVSAMGSIFFMALVCLYLLRHRRSVVVYTIDMDSNSFAPLVLLGIPVAVEMHSPKPANVLTRLFFRRVRRVIATNPLTRNKLMSIFNLPIENFIVEPNGVDQNTFDVSTKEEARRKLGLPTDAKIILYVGRFYNGKGMQVLQQVSLSLKEQGILTYLVGGTKKEFEKATNGPSTSLFFGGFVPHNDIALWCATADVLLALGTNASDFSYRYTAPMKLFEYLASGRPVVAADTPALRSLVSEQEVTFYAPDDPIDLAQKISAVFSHHEKSKQASLEGLQKAREHTWARRAERICTSLL